jgi:hypothetical protein
MKPKLVVVLAGLLGAGLLFGEVGLFVCIGIAVHAVQGTKQAIESLFILAFLIVTAKMSVSLGRWIILFAASGRVFWDYLSEGGGTPPILYPLLAYIGVVAGTSVVVSIFPLVSFLKLTTFAVGTTTVIIGLYQTGHNIEHWLSWLYTMGGFILVASIPFYFHPLGFGRNGVGFQGITNHPQTFGPILAPLTALFTGLYLFYPDLENRWVGPLALLGWGGMYLSLSRTSMFAAVLGLGLAVGVGLVFRGGAWRGKISRAFGRPEVILMTFLILGLSAVQWTSIQQEITELVFKDREATSVTETFQASRGALINQSMSNFWRAPLTGIGFGVPSDPTRFAYSLERGPMGIPISATVEKGFMPTAVLEETGVLGAALILVLLAFLVVPVVRYGNIIAFWVLSTALLLNFGEMVFFTMGGNGLYLWTVMGFCYCWSVARSTQTPQSPTQRRAASRSARVPA